MQFASRLVGFRFRNTWLSRWWMGYLLLALAILAAYAGVYEHSFLYDDEFLIQKNELLRSWNGIPSAFLNSSTGGSGGVDSFFRPLQTILYTVVYQVAGPSTTGFHLLNILLHILNAFLIFELAKKLAFQKEIALSAALLWALHPLHTEAITYQSATADPLYTGFVLAGLLIFDASWWAAGLSFVLALLSKETAIVFPALVMVSRYFQPKEGRWKLANYQVSIPYWLIAGAYFAWRKFCFGAGLSFYKQANIYTENILARVYTALATLPQYGELMLAPHDLHMDRAFPVYTSFVNASVLLGFLIVVTALLLIYRERKSVRPRWSFACLWFLVAHSPHTGILIPVNALFLEHWMYLPSVGLFLVTTEEVYKLKKFINTRWVVTGLAITLGILTFRQNRIWETPVTFYSHILQKEPRAARIRNNLGMALDDAGQTSAAIGQYEAAISVSDEYAQTQYNLGLSLLKLGNEDLALRHFKRSLEIDPAFKPALMMLRQIEKATR